jgi:hypothetical protein
LINFIVKLEENAHFSNKSFYKRFELSFEKKLIFTIILMSCSFQQTQVHENPFTASRAGFDQKGGPYEDYPCIINKYEYRLTDIGSLNKVAALRYEN